jgi:hypothetical protein
MTAGIIFCFRDTLRGTLMLENTSVHSCKVPLSMAKVGTSILPSFPQIYCGIEYVKGREVSVSNATSKSTGCACNSSVMHD